MEKVIITGADGFIGHCVTKHLLNRGCEVYGIGIDESKMDDLKSDHLHFIKAYFEDYANITDKLPVGADCFFHFAWKGIFGEPFKDYSLQMNNAKFACDAVMMAINLKCRKFVLASTINVLEARHYMRVDSIKPRYANIYAMSKLSAEMIGKTLAYQNGIEFNCGLIPTIYGEGNKSDTLINILISNLLKGQPSDLIPYDDLFDIIYVEDVAEAFCYIGEKGCNQKTYYIGHNKPRKIGSIVDEIVQVVNKEGVVSFGKYPIVNGINFELIDMYALEKDTGFTPSFSIKESIKKTADWMKDNI